MNEKEHYLKILVHPEIVTVGDPILREKCKYMESMESISTNNNFQKFQGRKVLEQNK